MIDKLLYCLIVWTMVMGCSSAPEKKEKTLPVMEQETKEEVKEALVIKQPVMQNTDLARDVDYLTDIEKDIVEELNKVRVNPKKYADEVLVPLKKLYSGNYFYIDGVKMRTREGVVAVDMAIEALRMVAPVSLLKPSKGLSYAAKIHIGDQQKTNTIGHYGSDGSSPSDRISRYGEWKGNMGENIHYGTNTAQLIVASLLVDDGYPSRGHRDTILQSDFGYVGVAYGPHPQQKTVCVQTFASKYTDR